MVSFSATSRVLHTGLKKHKQELQAVLNPTLTTEQQNRKVSIAKDTGLIKQLKDSQSKGARLSSFIGSISELVTDFKAKYSKTSNPQDVNNALYSLRESINTVVQSSGFYDELAAKGTVAKQGLTLGKPSETGGNQFLTQQSGSEVNFYGHIGNVAFDGGKIKLTLEGNVGSGGNVTELTGEYSDADNTLTFKGTIPAGRGFGLETAEDVELVYDLSQSDLFNGYKNADSSKRQDIIRSVFNADESGFVFGAPAYFYPKSETDYGFSVSSFALAGSDIKLSFDSDSNDPKRISLSISNVFEQDFYFTDAKQVVSFDAYGKRVDLTIPSYSQYLNSSTSTPNPVYFNFSGNPILNPSNSNSNQGGVDQVPSIDNFVTGLANLNYEGPDQFEAFSDSLDSSIKYIQDVQNLVLARSSNFDSVSSVLEERKSYNESLNEVDPLEQAQQMADIYQKIMLSMHSISVIANLQKETTNAFRQLSSS